MKKVCIIFLLSIIISLTAVGSLRGKSSENTFNSYMVGTFSKNGNVFDEYLRIHIRADSNEPQAQAVKYYVRDELVNFLTPLVAEYQTREQALAGVQQHLQELAQVASAALEAHGYFYGATVHWQEEEFPTRVYDNYTLPAGTYTALIINLGSGKGDNWWCVIYPPLCFAGENGQVIIYKSKILEIIENWRSHQ